MCKLQHGSQVTMGLQKKPIANSRYLLAIHHENIYLVVDLPWKMMEFVSWDDIFIPNRWKGIQNSMLPVTTKSTNQLYIGELTFCHGKSPFFMGKSTISMAIFHCFLYVHQPVIHWKTSHHRMAWWDTASHLWWIRPASACRLPVGPPGAYHRWVKRFGNSRQDGTEGRCHAKSSRVTLWWTNIAMENHHFLWENPLFLWPFSIAMLVHQRVCAWESWEKGNSRNS